MAIRPVYIISENQPFYICNDIEFNFCPGFSVTQKQKSIRNLHTSFLEQFPDEKVLEISSKSECEIGRDLSAFNLLITLQDGTKVSVESAFQSSKVFENGGPYRDMLFLNSYEAKKDERLHTSGKIIGFEFEGKAFKTEPKTLFYNWLYINALNQNKHLHKELSEYTAFTDIEFNPKKSINCQAIAAAVYVSLKKQGLSEKALESPESFLNTVYGITV